MINESYYQTDFIGKFINLNKATMHTISFVNINFINGLDDMFSEIKEVDLRIKKCHFESCNLGTT